MSNNINLYIKSNKIKFHFNVFSQKNIFKIKMFPITYLSFIYIFSLILIQLSFILYLFYGVNIPFQNFIVLNLFILFPLYILVYRVRYNRYDLVIILSLLYFLIVLPISSGFNIFETFKSYKDIILPYIIYLFSDPILNHSVEFKVSQMQYLSVE